MAVIISKESKEPPDTMIEYAADPTKTERYAYVSCIGCDLQTAAETFMKTKERYEKTDGIQVRHIIQSFKPGEVSPMVAHEIGNRFVKTLFDDYEVVLATHTDKPHVHNHIVFNSVSDKTGRKYQYANFEDHRKNLLSVSDQLSKEYGLSVIEKKKPHTEKRNEWRLHKDGMKTHWDLLYRDLDETVQIALDLDNFFELMKKRGYQVIRRKGKFPLFQPKGSFKTYGIHLDGRTMTEEDLQKRIERGMEEDNSADFGISDEKQSLRLTVETEKGFIVLYRSWLSVLKAVGQGIDVPFPLVGYEEIKRFRQYREHQEYLEKTGIETMEQLQLKIKEIEEETDRLKKEKSVLLIKRKQVPGLYAKETIEEKKERFETGEPDRREITENLDRTEEQIRSLKHELYICRRIENDAPSIRERLTTKTRDRATEKERTKHKARIE